jgi:excisionase family DNA binding protein
MTAHGNPEERREVPQNEASLEASCEASHEGSLDARAVLAAEDRALISNRVEHEGDAIMRSAAAMTSGSSDSCVADAVPLEGPTARARSLAQAPPASAAEPHFLTVDETAVLLRTTRKAVYALVERAEIPGVTRLGRRVLIHRGELLEWLDEKRTASPGRTRR